MLRSLFSGVSGMKSQQTKMDVIGNNIANVGTTAFKSGRVTFKDALSQTIQGANAPTANSGGVNPKAVGTGVNVSAIDTNMGQGFLQPTNVKTDIAIDGNGLFEVAKLDDNTVTANAPNILEKYFTRDGSFKLDKNGNFVTTDGYQVMGTRMADKNSDIINYDTQNSNWYVDLDKYKTFITGQTDQAVSDSTNIKSNTDPTSKNIKLFNVVIPLEAKDNVGNTYQLTDFSIEENGVIKALYGENTVTLGRIATANFQNTTGLLKKGGNLYVESSNSGASQIGDPNGKGFGKLAQGQIEMSNVDLANEFTDMIITSRAFQANSKTITTSDEMLQDILNLKR